MLGDAVAAAVAGLVPAGVLLVDVPPARGPGPEDEPEEAGGGAAAAVGVVPVVTVHGEDLELKVRIERLGGS